MAKTLLEGVNAVLKKLKQIQGDAGELTSLMDSQRQIWIDSAVSAWNEAIPELYSIAQVPMPNEVAENTITLVADKRDYDLQDDLVQMRWPLINETDGYEIAEYPGGFEALRRDQLQPQNFTGQPSFGAIDPKDGTLFLDRIPQSTEAGQIFKYIYDKQLELVNATDEVPFNNTVFNAMVVVVSEIARRTIQNKSDGGQIRINLGRAARLLTKQQVRGSWLPARVHRDMLSTDPFHA